MSSAPRTCTVCHVEKAEGDFYRNRKGFRGECKDCTGDKTYARTRAVRRDNRAEAVALLGGVCCRCGFSDPRALQIDHVNGGGVKEIRTIGTHGVSLKVLRGGNEYQLLCANCNWIKRAENGENKQIGHRNAIEA